MYATLITQIKAILEGVEKIANGQVYAHPATTITGYPAVVFFPDTLTNAYETTADNAKVYRFKVFVIVGTADKKKEDIFGTVLPGVVDAVMAAFDTAWNGGVTDGGKRIWRLLESGNWTLAVTDRGVEAVAELNLTIRLSTGV